MDRPEPAPEPIVPASPLRLPDAAPHEVKRASVVKALLGPVLFIGLFGLKWLKLAFVAVKGVKFFSTAASMVVSIGAYALIFGLPFGIGFVLLLLVHELGHAIQLRREGIPAGAPVFIPFLGAAIAMKGQPINAAAEARVGIAGPILGSAGALAVHGAALVLDSPLLLAIAFVGYFLNLFNLVPISPLDGGRIAAALHPKIWLVGILLMAGLFFLRPNPVLLLIVVLGGLDSWNRLRNRDSQREYYADVDPATRAWLAATWIGLMVALVLLMEASHVERAL